MALRQWVPCTRFLSTQSLLVRGLNLGLIVRAAKPPSPHFENDIVQYYQHPFVGGLPIVNARHKNTSGGSIAVAAAELVLDRDG
jgi:hypothetical protein